MPNGKYPIRNSQDLKDAIKLSGASDMPKEKVQAWIKKRAKELGLESELPEEWKSKEVEKTMDCNDANAICKEDLDDKLKGPEGDGIAKNEETETTNEEANSEEIEKSEDGLTVSMKFSSVEDAMIFKSVISEMIQEGKVKADVLERQRRRTGCIRCLPISLISWKVLRHVQKCALERGRQCQAQVSGRFVRGAFRL